MGVPLDIIVALRITKFSSLSSTQYFAAAEFPIRNVSQATGICNQ